MHAPMGEHKWRLIFGTGEDAPGKSLDEIFQCERCGLVRHDYRHGGGMTSPNYPVFYGPAVRPANHHHCPAGCLVAHAGTPPFVGASIESIEG